MNDDQPAKESEWKKNEKKEFDKEWNTILEKDIPLLTPYDKQFLVARRHMLSKDQQETYGDIINDTMNGNLKKSAKAPKKASGTDADDEDDESEEIINNRKENTMNDMDLESRKHLEGILAKDKLNWSDADKQFVAARRDQLSDKHKQEHADFINETLQANSHKDEQKPTDETDGDDTEQTNNN